MSKRRLLKWTALTLVALVVIGLAASIAFTLYASPTRREFVQAPIFTVGDQNYAHAIDSGRNVVKFGPLPFGIYRGGIAFRNHEDAAKHLVTLGKENDGWDVYRLSGDFKLDTYEAEGQSYIDKSLLVVARSDRTEKSAR